MKTILTLALFGAGLGGALPAHAAFDGPLAPATWSTVIAGPTFGSRVDTTGAPAAVTLLGGDDATGAGCPDGSASGFVSTCQVSFVHAGAYDWRFHWSYLTADITPQYDSFGVIVDGVRTELVANGGALAQSGDAAFRSASSFAFYLNCSDCTGGAAQATISALAAVTPVPEPASAALLGLGLLALLPLVGRRSAQAEVQA